MIDTISLREVTAVKRREMMKEKKKKNKKEANNMKSVQRANVFFEAVALYICKYMYKVQVKITRPRGRSRNRPFSVFKISVSEELDYSYIGYLRIKYF